MIRYTYLIRPFRLQTPDAPSQSLYHATPQRCELPFSGSGTSPLLSGSSIAPAESIRHPTTGLSLPLLPTRITASQFRSVQRRGRSAWVDFHHSVRVRSSVLSRGFQATERECTIPVALATTEHGRDFLKRRIGRHDKQLHNEMDCVNPNIDSKNKSAAKVPPVPTLTSGTKSPRRYRSGFYSLPLSTLNLSTKYLWTFRQNLYFSLLC